MPRSYKAKKDVISCDSQGKEHISANPWISEWSNPIVAILLSEYLNI